jgi:hypothetical protein
LNVKKKEKNSTRLNGRRGKLYPIMGNDHYYLVRVECVVRRNKSGCLIKKLLPGLD